MLNVQLTPVELKALATAPVSLGGSTASEGNQYSSQDEIPESQKWEGRRVGR